MCGARGRPLALLRMLSHYLGVGIKECLPCGGELVVPHGNCIFKVGRERGTRDLISSAFSVPLSPLTPASFKALHSTGAVTKSKESAADSILCAHPVQSSRSPPWRSPQGQQQVGSLVGAYLGCGRIGVHLTPRENTLGHFGLNLVIVSSLRCGAQRCIPFTPYFTFDHWIPKHRQTRPPRTDFQIFGVFCGGGPPRFASRWFLPRAGRKILPFWQNPTCSQCCQRHSTAWRVRSGSTPKMDTQSKSCTRVALCLIPRLLHPNGSRGRAENEREYGGDNEE